MDDILVQQQEYNNYVTSLHVASIDLTNKRHVKGFLKTNIGTLDCNTELADVALDFWNVLSHIKLTPLERKVIKLYQQEERSQNEIAKQLNISQQRVSFILHRIIRKVVKYAKKHNF